MSAARATIPLSQPSCRATRLNKGNSEKETWHLDFDLSECGLDYVPGDSFGLYPANDPELVNAVIAALHVPADYPVAGRTLRDVLSDQVSLAPAPDALFQLFSYVTGGDRKLKARALASGEDPDGDAATLDVLAALEKFPGIRPDPEAFVEALDPLQPRVYSISSSFKAHPGRISLTVDTVRYDIDGRTRLGVASTFLAGRIDPGAPLKVYVQKAHGFALPADPDNADHHGRTGHRRRAVPRLPARADGDQGARPQLAVLRPSAQRLRLLLRRRTERHEGDGIAHAALARLVARRRPEILCAGPHARSRPRSVVLDVRRRAFLCLRRCQAHGQGRRARAGRYRCRAWRRVRPTRRSHSSPI